MYPMGRPHHLRRVPAMTSPAWGGGATLESTILGTESANLIAYWPMNEASGAVADNAEGTAARDGAYTGVTLGQSVSPFTCPLFDGANDYNDIYSASLATAFNPAAGTMIIFVKVNAAGIWTDGTYHFFAMIGADANNRINIYKGDLAGDTNQLVIAIRYGATSDIVRTAVTPTTWFMAAITWDTVADQLKGYYNGVQTGSTQGTLGTYVGTLANGWCYLGSYNGAPAFLHSGYLAHAAIWTKALSAAQILAIWQASGLA